MNHNQQNTPKSTKSDPTPTTIHTRGAPMFRDAGSSDEDMESINRLAPAPLRADQVYVRSMFLCSTQPCQTDGCQFSRSALEQIAKLVIGQSVLTGHNRSSLPLARFYKAAVIERDSAGNKEPVYFVRAWFYWLRETSGAKDLLLNIDGGIYREVSLAWKYNAWRCSICNEENGRCGHSVGEVYDGQKCYRVIDRVTDVLEGSLVYKGADRDTHLSGIRSYSSIENEFPLILFCESDDPLFHFLDSNDLLNEKRSLDESQPAFLDGIDRLWARCGEMENPEETFTRFLTNDGVCFLERITESAESDLTFGEYTLLHPDNSQPGSSNAITENMEE